MRKKKLHVQMLGDFTLTYNGEKLNLERNGYTKASQLLQYLLYYKGEPIHRDRLVEVLYGDGDVLSPQNNLKVNIFRLRKLISGLGLPPGEYITQGHGCYTWEGEVDVELDTARFERFSREAMNGRGSLENRREMLLKAIACYTGEFLPMLSSSAWARAEASKYRETYIGLVKEACALLLQEGSGDSALIMCRKAVSLCPTSEELHVLFISALLDLRNYQEASEAYEAAVRCLSVRSGWTPGQGMLALRNRLRGGADKAEEIVEAIKRHAPGTRGKPGAYYCSFSCFVDCFNFVCRLAARSNQSLYVIMGALTNEFGTPLELGSELDMAASALQKAISGSLHDSDLFTRYSPSQFLIMVGDINRDNSEMVARRVSARFRELCASDSVQLTTSVVPGYDKTLQDSES
jgi:DNA-binding SARP family transcriptional activator